VVEEKPAPGLEKQPPPKRIRAKAKPKAQPQQQNLDKVELSQPGLRNPREPTHAPDEVPEQGPPPPSRALKQKHETPDQFWANTLKQMKEKKKQQYEQLAAAAF
jgi:hypothetical protein